MIRFENVSKVFPNAPRPAVDRLDLDIPNGTTCVLIGPSGCGKTTTMRIVNRLIEPTSGRILVEGEDVTRADPILLRRRIGYVIQQVGLFPHMTIAENIATVPQLLGWPAGRIARRVEEMLALVGLEPHYLTRHPRHLSGGQRQRVGVARALAAEPGFLMMDEPLGALDALTREQIQELILHLWWQTRKMFFFITHSVEEALFLATELIVMTPSPGRIAHRYKLDFGRRFIECRDARKVKSDPAFIALREDILSLIHAGMPTEAAA